MRKLFYSVFVFFLFANNGFSQSFVKVYTDLNAPYYGLNILPTANEQTAILGWYYGSGGDAFTTVVDSTGKKECTKTGYPRFVYENISSLTQNATGYVFFNSYGANNIGNPNVQSLIFNSDTLHIDTVYNFYASLYAYTQNINVFQSFRL